MSQTGNSTTERIYVKVTTIFDQAGYMMPHRLTWQDGRTFAIDEVRKVSPAKTANPPIPGDCYTVIIKGVEKTLFFERLDANLSPSRFGRWFVLKRAVSS